MYVLKLNTTSYYRVKKKSKNTLRPEFTHTGDTQLKINFLYLRQILNCEYCFTIYYKIL